MAGLDAYQSGMAREPVNQPSRSSLKAIGARLVALRESTGLRQVDFCKRAGIAQNTWNQYERGESRPQLDFAIRLVDTFGVTLDWIYLGDSSGLPHTLALAIQRRA